jgi:hypothetical protein
MLVSMRVKAILYIWGIGVLGGNAIIKAFNISHMDPYSSSLVEVINLIKLLLSNATRSVSICKF